jgi:NADH-quinone oxidoreductase subunit A
LGQSAGASIFIIIGLASIFVAASLFIYLDAGAQSEQRSEYECGFIPLDDGVRSPADIHFYLVGVLFLIFDVEVALLYPWLVADNLLI